MATLRLPALFTDHAVLQRRQPLPLWGWATPGERITATLAGQRHEIDADAQGAFRLTFSPLEAGGPHELVVRGTRSGEVTVRDLLVGEVWICSGQSNMDWQCVQGGFAPDEIAHEVPRMRLFKVPNNTSVQPLTEVKAAWTNAEPGYLASFSAVGFAFGRELLKHVDVPIGLIHTAWGGTLAEAWTSLPALDAEPITKPIVDRWRVQPKGSVSRDSAEGKALQAAWEKEAYHQDPGISAAASAWMAADLDESAWKAMDLPRTWESTGLDIDGAVWFRKAFEVPAAFAGKDLVLKLGAIDDFDTTWVNGVKVGGLGKETPNVHATHRIYPIPAAQVKAGRNVVAVRVFDHFGQGGIYTGPLRVETATGQLVADLAGDWAFRVELELAPKRSVPPSPFSDPQHYPAHLFNAMIAPLVPYAFQGAIWYQGESNAGRAEQYRTLLPTMISDWRAQWNRDFPFLIVQLNAWQNKQTAPGECAWAELRDAQSHVAATLPQTWRCVGIDTGEQQDIHPKNKPLIGWRLALLARRHVYGETDLLADSPVYAAHAVSGKTVKVRFANAQGLTALGGSPFPGFAIAGADRTWHWAVAVQEGDTVSLTSPQVPAPVAVRYGWSDFPEVRLVNAAGLPADCFRTDDWPQVTAGIRI